MSEDLKIRKEALRAEAKRARGLLNLSAEGQESLCEQFFSHIDINKNSIVGGYWPKGRELDTQILLESIIEKEAKVALPVIDKDTRVLKFARWHNDMDLEYGVYDICHPVISESTEWLEPDIFLVPLLAFDRQGYRLGYGGGFYDTTLEHYKEKKDAIAVGLGYAQQACLFNLPKEEHDIRMDWIITEQSAMRF